MIEKVKTKSKDLESAFVEMHHDFKTRQGYSRLQIAKKREALENVLIPWEHNQNIDLLEEAGFSSVEMFFKWSNFCGFVALK